MESCLLSKSSDWRLETLRLSTQWIDWSPVFNWILKLSAPTIRELDIDIMETWSRAKILMPDTLVFTKVITLRLLQHCLDDDNVSFDLLYRFPNLQIIHIIDNQFSSTTLFDKFFPDSMPTRPIVQAFTYKGADLSMSQCSRLFTGFPNCIKLGLEWYKADCANKSIRQITRNMTQLKILEVYLSCKSCNEIAEHIDDWTFAGLESGPDVPKLERITIHKRNPELLTPNILRNVPIRIPTLMSIEILMQRKYQPGHYIDCNCPEFKRACEKHKELADKRKRAINLANVHCIF